MTIEKKPFVNYTLDEEKQNPIESGKIFTIRLNPQEYKQLKENMKDLNIPNESTCMKFLAEVGTNVLHGMFGRQKIRWLFSSKRVKLEPE